MKGISQTGGLTIVFDLLFGRIEGRAARWITITWKTKKMAITTTPRVIHAVSGAEYSAAPLSDLD